LKFSLQVSALDANLLHPQTYVRSRSRICKLKIFRHYSHTIIQQSAVPSRRVSDTAIALYTQWPVVIKMIAI